MKKETVGRKTDFFYCENARVDKLAFNSMDMIDYKKAYDMIVYSCILEYLDIFKIISEG